MDGEVAELPCDIVSDILARLPADALVRLRTVCKSWNSLISKDSQFIKSQLQFSKTFMNHNKVFIFEGRDNFTLYDNDNNGLGDWKRFELPPPMNTTTTGFRSQVECCSDGLILLRLLTHNHFNLALCQPLPTTFILWNPNTGNFNFFSHNIAFICAVALGICYESLTDSYKVVIILKGLASKRPGSDVLIYDVKNGNWTTRNLSRYTVVKGFGCDGVVVNGLLHCVCLRRIDKLTVIAYFDFLENDFKEVPQPAEVDPQDQEGSIGLTLLRNQLCAYIYTKSKLLKVWVMKEYGKKESWTSLVVISIPSEISALQVLTFTVKGELLMAVEGEDLVVCNLSNNTIKTLCARKFVTSWFAIDHVESLVSPNFLQ